MSLNYKIEGGFDFNKELYNELFKENTKITNECLISREELEEEHIVLDCNHKFNYFPLYNEIINQKKTQRFNHLEIDRLSIGQIKCPYCRNIQNGILPFFPFNKDNRIKKIFGVNSPEKYIVKKNKCSKIIKSGKNKGKPCGKPCYFNYCRKHYETKTQVEQKKSTQEQETQEQETQEEVNNECCAILKTGQNKGKPCGRKTKYIIDNKKFCKLHYNIYMKQNSS